LEEAAGEFELASRRDPTFAVSYLNLANVRIASNDNEGAKDALTLALDKEPDYYKAVYNLALVHAKAGRMINAKAMFKQAGPGRYCSPRIMLHPRFLT
jgi:Tfp pilus assembly protein PilF